MLEEVRQALRGGLNELIASDLPDDQFVPVPCDCDPPVRHGPHYVPLRAIRPQGYLHGRIDVDAMARALDAELGDDG